MSEKQRKEEQKQFDIAKKWLIENGNLKYSFINDCSEIKVVFSKDEDLIELTGTDLIKLTLHMYNEVQN